MESPAYGRLPDQSIQDLGGDTVSNSVGSTDVPDAIETVQELHDPVVLENSEHGNTKHDSSPTVTPPGIYGGRIMSNEEGIQNLYNSYKATGDKLYLDLIAQLKIIHKTMDYYARYQKRGWLGDLRMAIKCAEEALTKAPPGDSFSRISALSVLGDMLMGRYNRCGTVEDLERAIKLVQEALELSTPESYDRATVVRNLGAMYGTRYQKFGEVEDLNKAIKLAEESLPGIPHKDPGRSRSLSNLGYFFLLRRQKTGSFEDLQRAIKLLYEALSEAPYEIPSDDNSKRGLFTNLWLALYARFEQLGDIQDFDNAISFAEKGLEVTPPEGPNYAVMLGNLGRTMMSKYMRFGRIEDLEQATKRIEEASKTLPADHPERVRILLDQGVLLSNRYQQFAAAEDLDQAIKWTEEAVKATPPKNPDRPSRLNNLARLLQMRSQRLGSTEDLSSAIKLLEEALDRFPNDPDRPDMVANLVLILQDRSELNGNVEDLNKAMVLTEKAAETNLTSDLNYGHRLRSFGIILASRYLRFGGAGDLEQAVKQTGEAVVLMDVQNPNRARYLTILGDVLYFKYKRFGAVEDLEQALKRTEEAVTIGSPSISEQSDWLISLGHLFDTRYQLYGALEDLEQALKWTEKAIVVAPSTHKYQAGRMSDLGILFQKKYQRLEVQEYLDQAIKWTKEALEKTHSDHAARGARLQNFALVLSIKYGKTKAIEDLTQAIERAEEALELIPKDSQDRRLPLRLLGRLLNMKFQRLGEVDSLETAIKFLEEAKAALPPNHPERAFTLFSLADILNSRYKLSGSTEDFQYILRILFEGWHSHTSPPFFRIIAGFLVGMHLSHKKRWQESSSVFGDCVKMLSKISLRSLARDDQEYRMSAMIPSETISIAVSVAFRAGEEASHCLGLLEVGRGLIMGLVIDYRSDLSELRSQYPQLSHRFEKLRIEIDSPLVGTGPGSEDDELAQKARRRREKAVDELDETVISIRELPGFEGFHLSPSSAKLMAMAAGGTIIVINSSAARSDAIIVTASVIKSIFLPRLSYFDVEKHMDGLGEITTGGPDTYSERNKQMGEILGWLWDDIVEPVFQKLGLEPVEDDNLLPRVWWIGVGKLGMAPFHAAGYHSPRSSTSNTISRVISSYTPTIKALGYARQKELQLLSKRNPRVLAVSMPTTPGNEWSPLGNATGEVKDIVKFVKGKDPVTFFECPSTAQVLTELPSYDAIHFACHGVSDPKSPSQSSLLLRKEDGTLDKLTVAAISNIKIKHAQIAYLSACSTAENSSSALVNESIYIASGFQLAGFSHVLATQWVSNDQACRQVAVDFYKYLFDGKPSGDESGHRKVSSSFHKAVKRLRKKYLSQPLKWGSFIHTGA